MIRLSNRRAGLLTALILALTIGACTVEVGPSSELSFRNQSNEPPAEPTLHMVESDGHPMAVWSKVPTEPAGTVVLLHGRTWSGRPDFDLRVEGEELSLMDGLFREGYATYALDMRGYGSTERDDTGWLSPDRAAKDLANVLVWISAEAGETPALLGWSLGSMVSQLTAQRNPELMSHLLLFGYPNDPDIERPIEEDVESPARAATTAEAAASDFIIPGSISQAAIDAYVEQALAADPIRVDWYRGHEWNELDPSAVTVPTLLLQGESDPLARTEPHTRFFANLGTAHKEWVVLAGGDHAAFLETPRATFIHALTGFIQRPRVP